MTDESFGSGRRFDPYENTYSSNQVAWPQIIRSMEDVYHGVVTVSDCGDWDERIAACCEPLALCDIDLLMAQHYQMGYVYFEALKDKQKPGENQGGSAWDYALISSLGSEKELLIENFLPQELIARFSIEAERRRREVLEAPPILDLRQDMLLPALVGSITRSHYLKVVQLLEP